jgi:hypothetical protein
MTPIELIHRVKQAGLRLEIASENRLKVDGDRSIQEQFLPLLKEQKTAILEALKKGDFAPETDSKNTPVLQSKSPEYSTPVIPFDAPYLIHHYDPVLGFAQKLPYIQTPAFNTEIRQARSFLKDLYLRGVDIEITPDRGLQLVPMPNHPTRADLKAVARLQHGIREQISNPIDLFAPTGIDKSIRLDDRHSCNECLNLTTMNTCRQVTKGGKFVAWLDAGAVDQPHRCDRFRVKAVRH